VAEWKPNTETQSVIDQAAQAIIDDLGVSLKIDSVIPGCDVVNADTFGTGVVPRYVTVALRGGYQVPVYYRGGISGFGVGTVVSVIRFREGDRYEVFGIGGSAGSVTTAAPEDAEYITYAANADLTNERVLQDGQWNTLDLSVASQAAVNFEPDFPVVVTTSGEVTEYTDIQDAIDNATGADGDVVVVPPGTYDENITLVADVPVVELFTGTVTIEATGGTAAVTVPATGGDYYINIHTIKAEQSLNSGAAANGLAAVVCNHASGTAIIFADLSCINTYDAGNANAMGIRNTAAGEIVYRGKDAEWNIYVMSEGDDWGSYGVRNESTGDITGYGTIFAYSPNDGAWAYCIQNRGAATITWAGNLHLECSTDGDMMHARGGATIIYNGDMYGYADEHIRGIIARDGACYIHAKGRMEITTPYSYAIGIESCYAGYVSSANIIYEGIIDVNTDDGSARGVEVIGGTCTGTITLLDVDVIVAGTGDSYGVDNEIANSTITVIGGRINTTSTLGNPYDLRQTAGTVESFATQHDTLTGTITWLDGVAPESLKDYAQGSLIVGGAVDWEDLVHPGAAGRSLHSTAAGVAWSASAGVLGTGVANQVAYWTGADTIAGDAGMTYDAATDTLTIAGDILLSDDHFIGITGDIRIEFDSSDGDIMLHLGDAAGVDEVQIIDSGASVVAYIDSDGNASFASHIAVGADAAINSAILLYLSETTTLAAGVFLGQYSAVNLDPSANFATIVYGYQGSVYLQQSGAAYARTGGQFVGVIGSVLAENGVAHSGSYMYGAQFFVDIEDTASTQGYGLWVETPRVDTGSLTTGYGIRIYPGTVGTGSITTLYGLYIDNVNAGTTNYAVYSAGGQSYHAGNIGIGMLPTANGVLCLGLPTENLEFIDAGSAGATQQDWVEVEVGGVQGYLHVYAAK